MDDFGTVLIGVVVVAIVVACLSYIGSGAIYRGLGRSGLSLDEPDLDPGPVTGSPAAHAEAQAEIRQMLQAKSDRMQARGQAPLDIEAEMADLTTGPAGAPADAALREEVRQLVVAGNERRLRRGEDPIDVEPEVDRQLRDLGA